MRVSLVYHCIPIVFMNTMYSPSRSRLEDLESNGSRWTGKRGKGSMLSSGKSVRRLMIFFVMCVFCLFYWTVVIPKATGAEHNITLLILKEGGEDGSCLPPKPAWVVHHVGICTCRLSV